MQLSLLLAVKEQAKFSFKFYIKYTLSVSLFEPVKS